MSTFITQHCLALALSKRPVTPFPSPTEAVTLLNCGTLNQPFSKRWHLPGMCEASVDLLRSLSTIAASLGLVNQLLMNDLN